MSKAKNKAVNVIKHPLIQHKLTHMRMKGTRPVNSARFCARSRC